MRQSIKKRKESEGITSASAIKHGHVEYRAVWELDKTKIKLSLAGVDGVIFISIVYVSKDYLDFLSEDLDENL